MSTIDVLEWCLRELSKGHVVALITVTDKQGSGPRDPGAMMAVSSTGEKAGTIGGGEFERYILREALEAIKEAKPRKLKLSLGAEGQLEGVVETGMLCGGVVEVFINVLKPRPRIVVVGAGHVGKPVADIGNLVGYRVVIVDSDPQLASKERYPYAERVITGDVTSEVEKIELFDNDVVFVAHGNPEVDYAVIKTLLLRGFRGHIWALCSKKRALWMLERLVREGIDIDKYRDRLHMPAGLHIGSDTPEEIAISVWSEIICETRKCEKPVKSLSVVNSAF